MVKLQRGLSTAPDCLKFDGNSDYIELGDSPTIQPLGGLTLEVWFRADRKENQRMALIRKRVNGYWIQINEEGYLLAGLYTSASSQINLLSLEPCDDGNWHHACLTFDGSIARLYIDGILVDEELGGQGIVYYRQGGVAIGRDGDADNSYFRGHIRDVRIWGIPRSGEEIVRDLKRELSGVETGLLGYWKLEHQYPDNQVKDFTMNGNDGIIHGALWDYSYNNVQIKSIQLEDSLSFDGKDDYVEIPYSEKLAPTEQITIEFWMNIDGVTIDRTKQIISKTQTGGYSVLLYTDTIAFNIHLGGAYRVVSINRSEIPAGWNHYSFTFDGRYIKSYLNGVIKETTDMGSIGPIQYSLNNSLMIATEASQGTTPEVDSYLKMKLCDVRIWETARTQEDILLFMNRRLQGNEDGLVGNWIYKATTDPTLCMDKVLGNHGNIHGATWTVSNLFDRYSSTLLKSRSISDAPDCLRMSKVGDRVDCDIPPLSSDGVSLEFWVNVYSRSSFSGLVSTLTYSNTSRNYGFSVNLGQSNNDSHFYVTVPYDGYPQFREVILITSPVSLLRTWNHICVTYSDPNMYVYVNGNLVKSIVVPQTIEFDNVKLGIGRWALNQTTYWFDGKIRDVRLWGVVRSEEEIRRDMNRELSGNELGLLGYWKLDENSDNIAKDYSVYGNDAPLQGGAHWDYSSNNLQFQEVKKTPMLLKFDGIDDHVTIPHSDVLNITDRFTIEAWVRADSLTHEGGSSFARIISKGIADDGFQFIVGSDGKIYLETRGMTPHNPISNSSITVDEMVHVACTYNGNTLVIYINGETDAVFEATGSLRESLSDIVIGKRDDDSRYWNGVIKEVRMWNIARTQLQLQMNANRKLTGNEEGLIGYWKLDDSLDNKVIDYSPNGNDGIIHGAQFIPDPNGVDTEHIELRAVNMSETADCLRFNGVNNYVNCGNDSVFDITDDLTLEAWIYIDEDAEDLNKCAVVKGQWGTWINNSYGLRQNSRNIVFFISDGTRAYSTYIPETILEVGKWVHISGVARKDDSKMRLYYNGKLVKVSDKPTGVGPQIRRDGSIIIGSSFRESFHKGKIRDVRIWNVARTQEEIRRDMNRELAGTEPGLVGYWKLDEHSDNIAKDYTPNGNHGTIYGAQWDYSHSSIQLKPNDGKITLSIGESETDQVKGPERIYLDDASPVDDERMIDDEILIDDDQDLEELLTLFHDIKLIYPDEQH